MLFRSLIAFYELCNSHFVGPSTLHDKGTLDNGRHGNMVHFCDIEEFLNEAVHPRLLVYAVDTFEYE